MNTYHRPGVRNWQKHRESFCEQRDKGAFCDIDARRAGDEFNYEKLKNRYSELSDSTINRIIKSLKVKKEYLTFWIENIQPG